MVSARWKGYTVNNKEDLHLILGILENIKLRLKFGRDNLKNYEKTLSKEISETDKIKDNSIRPYKVIALMVHFT